MLKLYNKLLYYAIRKNYLVIKYLDKEEVFIDKVNSKETAEGFFTSPESKLRPIENFITLVLFILIALPFKVIIGIANAWWTLIVIIIGTTAFISMLFPGFWDWFWD